MDFTSFHGVDIVTAFELGRRRGYKMPHQVVDKFKKSIADFTSEIARLGPLNYDREIKRGRCHRLRQTYLNYFEIS